MFAVPEPCRSDKWLRFIHSKRPHMIIKNAP
jgi:hypothetical protein